MNEIRTESIKKENKKAFLPFIIIVALSTIFGGFVGFFSSMYNESLKDMLIDGGSLIMKTISPYGIIVSDVIFIPAAIVIYMQSKKLLNESEMDQDEVLDQVEYRLNYPLLFTNICMIIDFFFFPAAIIYCIDRLELAIATLVLFLLSMVVITVIQQKVVDLEKHINPEKQGSIYDTKFAKKWEESCDEAQRLNIYKSSYIAFKTTSKAYVFIWVILVLATLFLEIGLLPVAVVTLLWLIQSVSYMVSAMRLEKRI